MIDLEDFLIVIFFCVMAIFSVCCLVGLNFAVFTHTAAPWVFWDVIWRTAVITFDVVAVILVIVGLAVQAD